MNVVCCNPRRECGMMMVLRSVGGMVVVRNVGGMTSVPRK